MKSADRLYELLPAVYRQRDAGQGNPLQALLRVITEQVDVVEDDIRQLYANWFIETCEDWVAPYIGDLIGYRPAHEAGEPGDPRLPAGRALDKVLVPRRDVANTIRDRRRKGSLALLEQLAADASGWPAHAVEFYPRLAWFQHLDHLHLNRGRTVDLRHPEALERIGGTFDTCAHTIDIRRATSATSPGRYNISSAGVFVWRLKSYSVTRCRALCLDRSPHCYTFSVFGNDAPLFIRPQREEDPTHIADETNVPAPIRRRAFDAAITKYYGGGKSIQLWLGSLDKPIPPENVTIADLSGWRYPVEAGKVAIDPVRGRIAFPQGHSQKKHLWVSYQYGFSADLGGGEYPRTLSQPMDAKIIRVSGLDALRDALLPWQESEPTQEQPRSAIVEITDSDVYDLPINLSLQKGCSLKLRAANGTRPTLRLLDWNVDLPDALSVRGAQSSRFTLDGLLVTGRGVLVSGPEMNPDGGNQLSSSDDLCDITFRHCTLVPGWTLDCDCEPCSADEASIRLVSTTARVKIDHCILGSIKVELDQAAEEPLRLEINDSIWDATSSERHALSSDRGQLAYARLTVARCTVFGKVLTHEIALAENSIFNGEVCVARRQTGCVRFCYLSVESRTPRRYECQPDLVRAAVRANFSGSTATESELVERDAELIRESERVEPEFNSIRYGTPTYAQLSATCASEISRGADDESELGAFHDLFQPQRAANLRARLDEYTPAGMDTGIIYAT